MLDHTRYIGKKLPIDRRGSEDFLILTSQLLEELPRFLNSVTRYQRIIINHFAVAQGNYQAEVNYRWTTFANDWFTQIPAGNYETIESDFTGVHAQVQEVMDTLAGGLGLISSSKSTLANRSDLNLTHRIYFQLIKILETELSLRHRLPLSTLPLASASLLLLEPISTQPMATMTGAAWHPTPLLPSLCHLAVDPPARTALPTLLRNPLDSVMYKATVPPRLLSRIGATPRSMPTLHPSAPRPTQTTHSTTPFRLYPTSRISLRAQHRQRVMTSTI